MNNKRKVPMDLKCSENKKRTSSKKKSQDEQQLESFCWICHQPLHLQIRESNTCPLCPRVYHLKCLEDQKTSSTQNGCPECLLLSVSDSEEYVWSRIKLNKTMIFSLRRIFADKKKVFEQFLKWPSDEDQRLTKIVDQEYLLRKLKNHSYRKPVEFLSDFKWLYHNCVIIYGRDSKIKQAAEQLIKYLQEELSSLEACINCYFDRNSTAENENGIGILKTCSKNHEVICAKVRGFPFWPAKCLKVTKKGSAHVVFFGTQEISCIPSNMWFSLNNQTKLTHTQQKYSLAVDELLQYINTQNTKNHKKIRKCDKKSQTMFSDSQKSVEKVTSSKGTQTNAAQYEEFHSNLVTTMKPEIVSVSSVGETCNNLGTSAELIYQTRNPNILNAPEFLLGNIFVPSLHSFEPISVNMTFSTDEDHQNNASDNIEEILSIQKDPFSKDKKLGEKNREELGDTSEDLNTTNLAKFISDKDPEFSVLFQEKSKELFDSLKVHMYNKIISETSKVNDENVKKELMVLRDKEKMFENKLKEAEVFMKNYAEFLNKGLTDIIQKKNDDIVEMAIRLVNIKKEREDILKNQTISTASVNFYS